MEEIISPRFSQLRKHLSERLGERLTTELVGERCGLKPEQVYRLEHGLNGTTTSLIALLLFYHNHGYSLEWVLTLDNSRLPMINPTGTQLQNMADQLSQLGQLVVSGASKLEGQLRELGYQSLTPTEEESWKVGLPLEAGTGLLL